MSADLNALTIEEVVKLFTDLSQRDPVVGAQIFKILDAQNQILQSGEVLERRLKEHGCTNVEGIGADILNDLEKFEAAFKGPQRGVA